MELQISDRTWRTGPHVWMLAGTYLEDKVRRFTGINIAGLTSQSRPMTNDQ
jgi:hypothetical protein